MPQTFEIAGITIALLIGSAVLAMLHVLAMTVRNDLLLQELTAKSARLRRLYRKQLAEANGDEVLIVDEAPPEPTPLPQPARTAA